MSRVPAARTRPLRILSISGPNLQLLGTREPEIYGTETLADIHDRLAVRARELGCEFSGRQTNHEGEIVTWIGESRGHIDGLLLNPGAYTHTSIAIYDALRATGIPCVEVHLSNPDAREAFRRRSRVAPACLGRVAGFGGESYLLALAGLVTSLKIWSNDGGRSK
ncbi:type II 3-dehydroquinate dehydratase [Pendulispora albinea]|uniref:3-dehydroquinate dehydratase n=1 Tax=Pendulispora albinea TaxID=2741071 RepID=A0ABZ2LM70_9BACT